MDTTRLTIVNIIAFVLLCLSYGHASKPSDTIDSSVPHIFHHQLYYDEFIICWDPPADQGNASVVGYLFKWKSSSDSSFTRSRTIQERVKLPYYLVTQLNHTFSFGTSLTDADGLILCSTLDIELTAIFNDSSTRVNTITVDTDHPEEPKLDRIECVSRSSQSIEVAFQPSRNFYANCGFKYHYVVSAEGQSKWNNDTEVVLEFSVTDHSAILEKLSVFTNYVVTVKKFGIDYPYRCEAATMKSVPGPVIRLLTVFRSEKVCLVSWLLPEFTYGDIHRYWVEVTRKTTKEKYTYKVQNKYRRALLANLKPNSYYIFEVWAENEIGNGTRSSITNVYK